jgi:transposase
VIGLPSSVRIFLYAEPVDIRRSFDGLSGLVRAAGGDPLSGHLWVFLSKRREHVKILGFDRGGFVIWHKRLEIGRFVFPSGPRSTTPLSLDSGQLALLLDGVDYSRVTRPARWEPKRAA